jgi:hypothetical protein
MLAELAAANAAFAVIKTAIANGREISAVGSQIASFVSSKEDLQKKVQKKKASAFHEGNDFEEFMALEAIKEKEEELKQYMIYCGRPGLWNDWVKFQAEARVARQEAIRKKKEQMQDMFEYGLIGLLVIGVGSAAVFLLYLAFQHRG